MAGVVLPFAKRMIPLLELPGIILSVNSDGELSTYAKVISGQKNHKIAAVTWYQSGRGTSTKRQLISNQTGGGSMLELIRELVVNYGRAEAKMGAQPNDDTRENAQEAFTLLQEAIEELEAKAARLDDLEKSANS